MTGRSFRDDERAVGVYIAVAILMLIAVSFMYAILYGPAQALNDYGAEAADGTEYEEYADEGRGYAWDAWLAIPRLAVILGVVYVLAMAVVLSSVG